MNQTRRPQSASLPDDSLAYRMREAAGLVAAVKDGANLTDAFERRRNAHADWSDGVRGGVRDLAWGTLRDFGRGDRILSHSLHKPLPPEVHALLLVALHRLEMRPDQAHTIVDQAVAAVGTLAPRLKGVANAILRATVREAGQWSARLDADQVAHHRHPQWWIERVRASFPDLWESVLAAGNQRPPMTLRINRRRTTRAAVQDALAVAGIGAAPQAPDGLLLDRPQPVSHLPGFAEGLLSVQDRGAQYAAPWLDLAPKQRVLDACSAPGGKGAHILELQDVDLLAVEIDSRRIERIRTNLVRLGLRAEIRCADARRREDWWDGRPFDRILADVPCSASGVVRRHPDIKWLRRADDIARFAQQQSEILESLWHTLAPGGKMLYVTCSVFEEENRGQVARFCARHQDAERTPLDGRPEQQLLPTSEHDGFFYALLRKRT